MRTETKHRLWIFLWVLVTALALYLRLSGLFRGLSGPLYVYHPDEAKQIQALFNFLQGDYLHYYGNYYYDGYPYGLNHVDEFLLRPLVFFLGGAVPDKESLYFYARGLRVMYGLVEIGLGAWLAWALTRRRTAALLAGLLLALSPLAVTVAHFATGDIGINLFGACVLAATWHFLAARHPVFWLFLAGLAVGAAFAAKYNGLLLILVPLSVVGLTWLDQRHSLAQGVRRLFFLGLGTLLGIVLLTPGLVLDLGTTLHNMRANFVLIRNYQVPAHVLEKPQLAIALASLKKNTPMLLAALGRSAWAAVLVAAWVWGWTALVRRPAAGRGQGDGQALFLSVLALFPPVCLLVSLAGKYMVQPFHFSYLVLPLVLNLVCLLFAPTRPVRLLALVLVLLAVGEYGQRSWQDNFFWRRDDNCYVQTHLPHSLYRQEALGRHRGQPIRSLFLEPRNISAFRNAKTVACGLDAGFWQQVHELPVPQVANPQGRDWIFVNGPVFPRNDRMFRVAGGERGKRVRRWLVLPGKGIPELSLGLRSGSFATRARVLCGGEELQVDLQAQQQKILVLRPRQWRTSGRVPGQRVRLVPLEVEVPLGDLWITVLASEQEINAYRLFGGGQENASAIRCPLASWPFDITRALKALRAVRYLQESSRWAILPGQSVGTWEVALPAGRFRLTMVVDGLESGARIDIGIEDARGAERALASRSFPVKQGLQRIDYFFSKPFVPYQLRLVVHGARGTCRILSQSIAPDYASLFADFVHWQEGNGPPAWMKRFGAVLAAPGKNLRGGTSGGN